MKTHEIQTHAFVALLAGLLAVSPALAQDNRGEAEKEELRAHREALFANIEAVRQEAERAAEEARMSAERLREETQRVRAESEKIRDEAEADREERQRQTRRIREELSRTHRELRRASQEVARAHRDLALAEDRRIRAQVLNLGDRAMMGVILGRETDKGISIVGISPDGPAERAGVKTGDVLVSLRGESLDLDEDGAARARVYEIMSEVNDGEEISAAVLRDGERWEFMIKPEKREPASWASFIRLPSPPDAPGLPNVPNAPRSAEEIEIIPAPAAPAAPAMRIERLAVPPVDVAELAAEAEALAHELDSFRVRIEGEEGDPFVYEYDYSFAPGNFDFDSVEFAEIAEMALNDAQVWLGGPAAGGFRFTELNDGLKPYFAAERGVLVLDAPADNAFGLRAGDVLMKIGEDEVNATADIVRALRDIETGERFTIAIKRDRKKEDLDVVMPENRLGRLSGWHIEHREFAPVIVGSKDD